MFDDLSVNFDLKAAGLDNLKASKLSELKLTYYLGLFRGNYQDEVDFLLEVEGKELFTDAVEILSHND